LARISRPTHDEETWSTLAESCFKQQDNGACRGPPPSLACLQAVYAYTTALEDPRLDDVWTPKIPRTGICKKDRYPWMLELLFLFEKFQNLEFVPYAYQYQIPAAAAAVHWPGTQQWRIGPTTIAAIYKDRWEIELVKASSGYRCMLAQTRCIWPHPSNDTPNPPLPGTPTPLSQVMLIGKKICTEYADSKTVQKYPRWLGLEYPREGGYSTLERGVVVPYGQSMLIGKRCRSTLDGWG